MEEWWRTVFLVGGGVFGIAAAYYNWDWFYTDEAVIWGARTEKGRFRVRVFYFCLGVALIVGEGLLRYYGDS